MTFTSRLSLLVALVAGGVAAFLVYTVLTGVMAASTRARATGTIVVARTAIPFGAALTAENLQEVAWSSADPLGGSFATIGDLTRDGRRLALVSLQRSEPVLASRVTGPNQRSALSMQLGTGMRAVTIRVDEVRGVAGFVLPGDRVDVIVTRGEGGSGDAGAYADVLLQDTKVLAVDQLSDERQDKPTVARAVTLELTVQQAQKVVLAEGVGRLSLALRQANAAGQDAAARVTVSDLGGADPAARDRMGDIDKHLADLKSATEAAIKRADADTAQKLSDLEARLRGGADGTQPPLEPPMPQPPAPKASARTSVVNVMRDGSKLESYTVPAER